MSETPMTPYLYTHENPYAPVRANGVRFHGYPERQKPIVHIVAHTAENTPDYIGQDGGAEAVASFQSRVERPSSYHEIGDSDSYVTMLPDEAVAFGARGANADGWHYSFATRAYLWMGKPQSWIDQAINIGARRCALRAKAHDIPVRRLTRAQYEANQRGFVAHADVDPARRSDPGPGFPWGKFLKLVATYMEDPMATLDDEDVAAIAEAVTRSVWEHPVGRSGDTHSYTLSRARADAAAARALVEGLASDASIDQSTLAQKIAERVNVDVEALAATLGHPANATEVADELARRLTG